MKKTMILILAGTVITGCATAPQRKIASLQEPLLVQNSIEDTGYKCTLSQGFGQESKLAEVSLQPSIENATSAVSSNQQYYLELVAPGDSAVMQLTVRDQFADKVAKTPQEHAASNLIFALIESGKSDFKTYPESLKLFHYGSKTRVECKRFLASQR